MSLGLPVVVTSVGGLPEAASGYTGPSRPPRRPRRTQRRPQSRGLAGQKFPDPRNWHDTVTAVRMAASTDQPEQTPR